MSSLMEAHGFDLVRYISVEVHVCLDLWRDSLSLANQLESTLEIPKRNYSGI